MRLLHTRALFPLSLQNPTQTRLLNDFIAKARKVVKLSLMPHSFVTQIPVPFPQACSG